MDLTSALALGPRESVALVGGGGKSALMFALSEELSRNGKRVVAATTTRVARFEAKRAPCLVLCAEFSRCIDPIHRGIDRYGWVFVAEQDLPDRKIQGITPETADELFRQGAVDHVVIEADGAAGCPVKVPVDHEPVIPRSATLVIALMGLEALGQPFGPDTVFRPERFSEVTGLSASDQLTPGALVEIFRSKDGLFRGAPSTARRVAFLNKADLVADQAEADKLARLISFHAAIERVVVASVREQTYNPILGEKSNSCTSK